MDGMQTQKTTQRVGRNIGATIIVALMIVAALSMWTVIPLGWVWVGSRISKSQAPSGGPYMVVLVGIVVSILVISWLLGRLNRVYVHLTGTNTVAPIRAPWLKSLRDSDGPNYPTVLETVIVTSVILAIPLDDRLVLHPGRKPAPKSVRPRNEVERHWHVRSPKATASYSGRAERHTTNLPSTWSSSPSTVTRPPWRRSQTRSSCTADSLTPPVSG